MTSPFGLLIVKKPLGLSSHDVVSRVRRRFNWKVGHGGTLDPLATGVLPLLINDGTKLSPYMTNRDKAYRFTMKLGERTTTLDKEGEITETRYVPPLTEEDIVRNTQTFCGEIEQTPPMFSAVKVGGKPLYKSARKGQEVERKSRWITIYELTLISMELPHLTFNVSCSKGTYIRQLALDMAEALGTTAHVTELERTKSGPFGLDKAIPLDEILEMPEEAACDAMVSPLQALSFMPQVVADQGLALDLSHGKKITLEEETFPLGKRLIFIDPSDRLLAIGEQTETGIQPVKVFTAQVQLFLDNNNHNCNTHTNQEF